MALAGPHQRYIMTSIPGEKFPTWPPATAARLTPHTASHLEADEKVPMTMNFVLAAHGPDIRLPHCPNHQGGFELLYETLKRVCARLWWLGYKKCDISMTAGGGTKRMVICSFDLEIRASCCQGTPGTPIDTISSSNGPCLVHNGHVPHLHGDRAWSRLR